jgi:hypothetical protein
MLTLAEDVLVACIKKRPLFPHVIFYEVPEDQRNPEMPLRIQPGLPPEFFSAAQKASNEG